jgi:hypothetical protein
MPGRTRPWTWQRNSKLLQSIRIAVKQFKAHDPPHAKPRVTTFA